jgi:hypothetical protein
MIRQTRSCVRHERVPAWCAGPACRIDRFADGGERGQTTETPRCRTRQAGPGREWSYRPWRWRRRGASTAARRLWRASLRESMQGLLSQENWSWRQSRWLQSEWTRPLRGTVGRRKPFQDVLAMCQFARGKAARDEPQRRLPVRIGPEGRRSAGIERQEQAAHLRQRDLLHHPAEWAQRRDLRERSGVLQWRLHLLDRMRPHQLRPLRESVWSYRVLLRQSMCRR